MTGKMIGFEMIDDMEKQNFYSKFTPGWPSGAEDAAFEQVRVAPDGSIRLSSEMLSAMKLPNGGLAIASVHNGELRILAPRKAVEKDRARKRNLTIIAPEPE